MSWQAYVDDQICRQVSSKIAIIASLQDGAIWAKQDKSEKPVTQQELKVIADTLRNNPQAFLENGIHLGGEKYFCLNVEPNLVRVSTDGFQPGVLNLVVERLADYLVTNNF